MNRREALKSVLGVFAPGEVMMVPQVAGGLKPVFGFSRGPFFLHWVDDTYVPCVSVTHKATGRCIACYDKWETAEFFCRHAAGFTDWVKVTAGNASKIPGLRDHVEELHQELRRREWLAC